MNALRTLLGLVVLLVVGLVVPEVASAKPVIGAETRVGAFNPDGQVRAGVEADAGARVHRGFADAKYDFTAGSPHAARAGPKALPQAAKMARHHLFPRQFGNFFKKHGINIDDFTVTVPHNTTHLKGIHGRGLGNMPGGWNQRWRSFIESNPNATTKEVYQHLGKMMDDFGLSGLPIGPYR